MPIQVVDKQEFKDLIYTLKPGANIPRRPDLIDFLEEIGKGLAVDVANMLRNGHVGITTDGWTFCANDSYLSLTAAFIAAGWELVTIPMNCYKSQGSTKA